MSKSIVHGVAGQGFISVSLRKKQHLLIGILQLTAWWCEHVSARRKTVFTVYTAYGDNGVGNRFLVIALVFHVQTREMFTGARAVHGCPLRNLVICPVRQGSLCMGLFVSST